MNSKKKSKSKNKRTKGSKTKEEVSLDGGGRSKERVSKKRTKEIKTKEIATAEEHGTLDEACAKTTNSLRAENEDAMLRVMEKALTHNHWFHGMFFFDFHKRVDHEIPRFRRARQIVSMKLSRSVISLFQFYGFLS
uniref:Uncharacterized protein n=1 Tax=Panagrolaimus sp. PS1159 TaxID=55785 RepID=A0AC35GFZ6_9BILA